MDIEEIKDQLDNLDKWKIDGRVQERLKDTGFDGLLRLTTFPVNHNLPLLSALVKSYHVKKRCFIFNGHELVFGLEDVLYITGLPIDGDPVTGVDLKGRDLSMRYLGRNGCDQKSTGVTSLAWLQKNFEVVPETIHQNSPEIEPYVRAFLLYLLGSVVVPDYSKTEKKTVPLIYLSLMENLQSIKGYAWGAALLAHLHVSLENFKHLYSPQRKNILMGHTYSLMVFAMERIPKLQLRCSDGVSPGHDHLPTKFPLLVGWAELLSESSNTDGEVTKQVYLEILGELEEDDIVWQPYKRLPRDFLPQYCAGQEKIGMSRTILLCFEKAVYHRPDLSPKQFGIQKVYISTLRPIIKLELLTRTGRKGLDWGRCGKYGYYKREWENRASCLITESIEEVLGSSPFYAISTKSSPVHNNLTLPSKRKKVDHVDRNLNIKIKKTSTAPVLVDTCGSTNSLPSGDAVQTESQLEIVDLDLILDEAYPQNTGVDSVASDQEELLSIHPLSTTLSLLTDQFDSDLFSIEESHKLLDELSSLLADFNKLLLGSGARPSDVQQTIQETVNTAKETIRGILGPGFGSLTNSEAQETFLLSSKVLLSAGVFPSDHLKTRLTAFRDILPNTATAFLQAQKDIETMSELSSLQEFLDDLVVKFPSLQERFGVAVAKIAHLRAILDSTVEKRDEMDGVLGALFEKTKIAKLVDEDDMNTHQLRSTLDACLEKRAEMDEVLAAVLKKTLTAKQKLASMNSQAADVQSKKRAAKMLIEQCESSWFDLRTSLLRHL